MRGAQAMLSALVLLSSVALAAPAHAWELFRSESDAVVKGNEHLAKKQHKEALEQYDRAARELPDDPGVQLDRGLALLGLNKLAEAREAFRRAGQGGAPPEIRGPGLYNLGLAFMQEADQAAQAEDFDGAKKLLTEGIDALRGSLRAQPGNPSAAWNLQLAKRRLADVQQKQEEKKKQEEEKKKDQKDQDKQDQDKQDKQDGGTPEQQDGGGQPSDADGGAQPEEGDAGEQSQPDQADGGAPDAGAPAPQPGEDDGGAASEPEPQKDPRAMPEHMQRALDALEANEENLEKQRARQRARTRPRRIEKDW